MKSTLRYRSSLPICMVDNCCPMPDMVPCKANTDAPWLHPMRLLHTSLDKTYLSCDDLLTRTGARFLACNTRQDFDKILGTGMGPE